MVQFTLTYKGEFMQAVVDRIEGRSVILRLDDGGEIRINGKWLMVNGQAKEGMVFDLSFRRRGREEADRKKKIDGLLEEITGRK